MQNINFELYKPSDLELWLSDHYLTNDILSPFDLTIKAVANIFDVDVKYYDGAPYALWEDDVDGFSFIFLNCNKSNYQQKKDFFHELCHPLRHVGDQELLPKLFQQMQEIQAAQFQLISAMPIYLLEQIPITNYWESYLHLLSEVFEQPISLVTKRMQHIIAKIEQERLDRQSIILNLYAAESSEQYRITR